jgi:hypothetical protein
VKIEKSMNAPTLPEIRECVVCGNTRLRSAVDLGKVFPERAAIPIRMPGLSNDRIVGCYEKPSSAKVGHDVPGSRIAILLDHALSFEAVGDDLRGRGYRGEFLDIISPDDFAGPP